MFEVFLFIDPLCKSCRNSENTVLKLSEDIDSKFKLQFVPIYNLKVVQTDFCNSNNQLKKKLSSEELSYLYKNVVLDYKAASFQGMKKGRRYLLAIQDKILSKGLKYSDELAIQTAKECNLDVEMFEEDRRSKLAIDSIEKDQQLVNDMNVDSPASAVIFNCSDSERDGILTRNVEYSTLFRACCDTEFTPDNIKNALSESNLNKSKRNHLHIIK